MMNEPKIVDGKNLITVTEGPTPEMQRIYEAGRGKLPKENERDLNLHSCESGESE
ncbi:hypothetical protein [Oceanobacillus neutriphilus]|nr:hypothetical protein [Oceanobacillus neutriphilus]